MKNSKLNHNQNSGATVAATADSQFGLSSREFSVEKLKRAVKYGALIGVAIAPVAAAVTVGFDSALIYFRYALHWGVGFSVIGAWAGAMFFAGEYGAVGHPVESR